jgi:uncharacterized membrane protein YgdD (TMEM256/DUF423 family)
MIDKSDVSRPLLGLAGLCGAAGVGLLAVGVHGSELDTTIGAAFLLVHGVALIGISLLPNRLSRIAGYVLVVGLVSFAGDLLLRGQLHQSPLPLLAPMGGVGLMAGWLLLAASALLGWRKH